MKIKKKKKKNTKVGFWVKNEFDTTFSPDMKPKARKIV